MKDQTKPRLPTSETRAVLVRDARAAASLIRAGRRFEKDGDKADIAASRYAEAERCLRNLANDARAAADDLKRYRATLRVTP